MDLSSLKDTLGLRDVRIAPGQPLVDAPLPSVVNDIFARHRKSTQPESQQLCLILSAVLDVIRAEGLQPTPTALFAALMSSIERPETAASPEVCVAMCTLVATILPHVPTSVQHARAVQAGQVFIKIIEERSDEGLLTRAALPCLIQLTAAMNTQDWPALSRGFNLVVAACLASQPKLRKKAQTGVGDILASLQTMPAALAPASEAVLKICQRVLPGPQAAAQAAAAAPSKKRAEAEAAIKSAVADALHLLGMLKQTISLLTGEWPAEVDTALSAYRPGKKTHANILVLASSFEEQPLLILCLDY